MAAIGQTSRRLGSEEKSWNRIQSGNSMAPTLSLRTQVAAIDAVLRESVERWECKSRGKNRTRALRSHTATAPFSAWRPMFYEPKLGEMTPNVNQEQELP